MTVGGKHQVSIATDVSCQSGKVMGVATWAIYISGDFGEVKRTGQFHNYSKHTAILELQAVCNAIHLASQLVDLRETDLTIYTEISHLFEVTLTKAGNVRKHLEWQRSFLEAYLNPALQQSNSYLVIPVKAHRHSRGMGPNAQVGYAMNRWCDHESRKLMKKLRDYKYKELRGSK